VHKGIRKGRGFSKPRPSLLASLSSLALGDATLAVTLDGVEVRSLLDEARVEALRNRTLREATPELSRLPEKERRLKLGVVRQPGSANNTSPGQNSGEIA
jgi:hypothetical protein